jgi:Ca-activated chloride channel homolog
MRDGLLSCKLSVREMSSAARLPAALVITFAFAAVAPVPVVAESPSVRITSPLGRIGKPGAVRIVAQVAAPAGRSIAEVRFSVDGVLLSAVTSPPYAADWNDENPFERREILVEALDDVGESGRDKVVLNPFELTEATDVTSVLVEAGVYDAAGRPVRSASAADFVLEEDGHREKLDMVSQETVPTLFALLVDGSQSMWRNIDFVRDAAARLVAYLREKDRVLVAPFGKGLKAVTGPTNDRQTILDAVSGIRAEGGTAVHDAVVEAVQRLGSREGRRVIVLITDAYDENSRKSFSDAVEAAKAAGVTIYTVGIGGVAGISMKGHDELKALAAATGGKPFFPARPDELPRVYDLLASDAQTRYLLTYTPSNQKRDGTWRTISVRTADGTWKVKARSGYFAPKPPPIRPSIEFTAMDLQSEYLQISADDLVVLEDGVEQKVDTFQEATTPVSLVLALDASGSMKKSAEKVVEAARAFVETVRPDDKLGIVVFADQSVVAHDLTLERDAVKSTINQYSALGGTALYDGLCDSFSLLNQAAGRRAIVVLTDGRDENNPGNGPGSTRNHDDVVKALRGSDVTVFTVGLGTKIDAGILKALAAMSGGQAYFPTDVSELVGQYERVTENLRHRYVLSYTSTNYARNGAWRTVQIRSRATGVIVSSRSGYYAPDH